MFTDCNCGETAARAGSIAGSAEGRAAQSIMRVRFAPSPTGQLHVGNARTALFNWLLAHGKDGTFILRIEDTDAERSTTRVRGQHPRGSCAGSGSTGTRGRTSAGLHGPYRQSERLHLYASYANELLSRRPRLLLLLFSRRSSRPIARRDLAAGRPPKYHGTCRDHRLPRRRAAGSRRASGR